MTESKQAFPPAEQAQTTEAAPQDTTQIDSSAILDKLNTATQQKKVLWTCANRFNRFASDKNGLNEGSCQCTDRLGKISTQAVFQKPIRCDEAGEPLPDAQPLEGASAIISQGWKPGDPCIPEQWKPYVDRYHKEMNR